VAKIELKIDTVNFGKTNQFIW